MKKIFYTVLLGSMFMLQSCFEIIEQVYLKNDGSGNFQLLFNLSSSKTKLNSIMKMKTANGHRVPDKAEITQKVAEIERTIKNTAGISNTKTSLDFENYIFSLTCNFVKVDNLNEVIKKINDQEKNTKPVGKTYEYDVSEKTFSRLNTFILKDEYKKMSNADKEIFATAYYTSIFRFDKEVSNASNSESKISANKKAVMIKMNALNLLRNTKSIENKINLTKL